ncbi:SLBB domain-containing protein [Novosphingobium sp. PASSN1]|uniref:SLBB domain-containing protein n=1 Tax=Novosphingobium sp. PASSN1 TaxID=2015561 RepID=UPI0025EA8F5B|nr:SLBB domain-containing protein [Novosphingobium sp. PASSN1]
MKRAVAGVLASALTLTTALPVQAQAIDPRVLQQLQGQLGGNSGAGAVDAARDAGDQRPPAAVPGARIDTREEQELRRTEARIGLNRYYTASPIEREFRERMADPTLKQFGYDLFQAATGTAGALTGAVGDDYVIGTGDDVVVQFQGATNDSKTVRVSRDGRLIVGSLPPIPAAGRSLAAVRRDLQAATRRTMLGTDVYLSLGSVRAVTVFVGGEVDRPGQYNLTALSDISAALAQAGGVRRSGSLRNIRVVRGGSSISVDVYGLLGIGTPPALRLQDGDRVIVPVIGDTVAISGSVARPGIYEIRKGTSLGNVLAYAGGALRPRGNQVAISRITADGSEQYLRAATLATTLVPGDGVAVIGGSAGGSTGRVVLRGYVGNPGTRALVAAPTVHDLLGDISDLRANTYLPMAILIRRDPQTASRVFEPINLLNALNNRPNVALRSDDRLYVFSRSDIDFLNRTAVRRVVLGQPNSLSECASLDRLEALVRDGQSARFNVVTRAAFIVERGGQSDVAATGGSLAVAGRGGDATLRSGDDQVGLRSGAAPSQRADARDPERDAAGDVMAASRCPLVFEEEPDLLPVLIENAVAVGGAVRRPGAYPIAGQASAADLAAVAEGVQRNSSAMTLDITRADGAAATQQRIAVDGYPTALASTIVSAGDDLRFNAAQPQFEAGGVLLTGEVNRPGLYSIRKGETLSQLLARAGGLSPLAYPYGTIFTRRSVKELQQEGLRRTARELTQSLLAVSARKQGTGDGMVAAQGLIQQLATLEAPGRVVVEADPRVLEQRPDLDTVLESGDAIVMPKRPNFVLALGDVANPGALQFVKDKPVAAYVRESGGTASTADKGRIFLVLPNGTAQPIGGRGWGRDDNAVVPPGSTIIVPKNIDPLYKLDVARDITGILGSLITSVATLAILATN